MHKKIIQLVLIAFFIGTVAFAQKPAAGKWSTEVIFNPFPPAISLNQLNGGIKFRKFLKEKMALRLGANIGGTTNVQNFTNPLNESEEGEIKNSTFNVVIFPGLEFHLAGTEKLSPYFGFDLGAGYATATEKLTNLNPGNSYREDYGRERTQNFLSYHFNALVGADYYVAQNVFLGAEFGLRVTNTQTLDTKTTYSGTAVAPVNPPFGYTNSNMMISTIAVSGFRLGIVF